MPKVAVEHLSNTAQVGRLRLRVELLTDVLPLEGHVGDDGLGEPVRCGLVLQPPGLGDGVGRMSGRFDVDGSDQRQ